MPNNFHKTFFLEVFCLLIRFFLKKWAVWKSFQCLCWKNFLIWPYYLKYDQVHFDEVEIFRLIKEIFCFYGDQEKSEVRNINELKMCYKLSGEISSFGAVSSFYLTSSYNIQGKLFIRDALLLNRKLTNYTILTTL